MAWSTVDHGISAHWGQADGTQHLSAKFQPLAHARRHRRGSADVRLDVGGRPRGRRRGFVLASGTVQQSCRSAPGAGLVHGSCLLSYLRRRVGERCGGKTDSNWKIPSKCECQFECESQRAGGSASAQSHLHVRHTGAGRIIGDRYHRHIRPKQHDHRRHADDRGWSAGGNAHGKHFRFAHLCRRPVPYGKPAMERRRTQFHDLSDRRHSGRRLRPHAPR
jgi:hypothetical protein